MQTCEITMLIPACIYMMKKAHLHSVYFHQLIYGMMNIYYHMSIFISGIFSFVCISQNFCYNIFDSIRNLT